ncbi:isopropylmalate/homocitrate/citramalate synthase [Pseudomonas sp. M5]|nr:isopropylmalate/homocitrate/citramalate synthase [Pseudomonas sp. M5]
MQEGIDCIALAKEFDLKVSANVTHVTQLAPAAISELCLRAEAAGADVIAFADSNGSMIPADVERLISRISRRVLVPLGFHAHNNLSLALSNAIAAMEAGAEYIDTSICGMGKGAGNLHLGMFIAYLQRAGLRSRYDLVEALTLSQRTAEQVPVSHIPPSLLDIITGTYDLAFDAQAQVEQMVSDGQAASGFHAAEIIYEASRQRPAAAARSKPATPFRAVQGHSQ